MVSTSNPLKWHGGKTYLAECIITEMPPHTHYVEPFFGGGAVLFAKPYEGVSEVVNDIDGELTNFWRVLRDPSFDLFQRWIESMPMSEVEWKAAAHPARLRCGDCDPYAAMCFFVKYRQSRQGLGKCFATLSRNRTRRGMNEQASSWLSAVEGLPEAHERLKRVAILNHDAVKVIEQQDGDATLFYCDPPYLHETRSAKSAYAHEMSADDHQRLLATLANIKGKFILSGYESLVYDDYATAYNWRRVDIETDNKSSSAEVKEMKTECLWMNY